MKGFDKNSIIGILLIGAIMFGWLYYQTPSKEEVLRDKRRADSIAALQPSPPKTVVPVPQVNDSLKTTPGDTLAMDSVKQDSVRNNELAGKFGDFSGAALGEKKYFTIENEFLKATISSQGGQIVQVQLKEGYTTYDKKPLLLFDSTHSFFGIDLITNKTQFNTAQLYFKNKGESFTVSGEKPQTLTMILDAGKGRTLEYEYSLKGNDRMVGLKIRFTGFDQIIPANQSLLDLHWTHVAPSQEKDLKTQQNNSTVYYKYLEDDADYLSEAKNDSITLAGPIKWVAFKQQFFSSILIADGQFDNQGSLVYSYLPADESMVKRFGAILPINFTHEKSETAGFKFYFGPNHYNTLKKYDDGLQKVIPLGWGLFGWVNRFLVIPIFNFFDDFGWNYGIIILCLTIIIKLILFPIAYKTYLSSAKMRVLKPELDVINKKFEGKSPVEKQQAQMALYKKAGVNPLAGCIPVLLQLPILFALVRFFPASIELRQQSFLWADDLSTYDSIWNFGKIAVIDTIYGDHMSLFAILMTISTLLYTYSNSQLMGQNDQMPGMKYMIYIMPILFLPFMNNFSAGLSYYYFLANMITFGQTYLMRFFVDEKKLHAKIEENKKKPVKVSKFQQRLAEVQKQRRGK